MTKNGPKLILASGSSYKIGQLQQLGLKFDAVAADVDESPIQGEDAKAQSLRLAKTKALHLCQTHNNSIIIGCDQSARLQGHFLCKPLKPDIAKDQLKRSSGQRIKFYSAVAIYSQGSAHQKPRLIGSEAILSEVLFRTLSESEIDNYIKNEDALGCAGAFKVEGLGINLFESISSQDPSALIGLPLIATAKLLRSIGISAL